MKNMLFKIAAALCFTIGLISFSAYAGDERQFTIKPYHQDALKNCATCHTPEEAIGGKPYLAPSDETCTNCHGDYESLKARTEPKTDAADPNPHHSEHYFDELSCTACHKQHEPAEVYCNNCHEFNYENFKP